MLLHQYGEGLFRFFLRRKVLDDADTRDVLMNECIQVGSFFTENTPAFVGEKLDNRKPDD